MSALALDEDAAAFAEALAFVDAFPLSTEGVDWAPSLEIGTPSTLVEAPSSAKATKKKRVRDPAVDARRRLKRKEERETLRRLVKELERELGKARRAFCPRSEASDATDGDDSDRSAARRVSKRTALRWFRLLADEKRKRRDAEVLNLQLRSEVEAQASAICELQQCLGQCGPEPATAATPNSKSPASTLLFDDSSLSMVLDELGAAMTRLYKEANECWDPSLVDSVTSNFSMKTDPVIGRYCEASSSTPLGLGMSGATDLIRRSFLAKTFPMPPEVAKAGKTTRATTQATVDLSVNGSLLRLYCVFVLRWHHEAERVVFSFVSIMFHAGGKFCFREGGWMVVQQSVESPGRCSFQHRKRLASQIFGESAGAGDDETTRQHSVGLAALTRKTKLKGEVIQRRLLVETGMKDLAHLLPEPHSMGMLSSFSKTNQWAICVDDSPAV